MLNEKRLTQIEASLTPKQAVRLWLRQEFQGKTTQEYDRWLIEQPVTAFPRMRVERQVVGAIQAAMKGLDLVRVQQAARQAHMETDFLILLVFPYELCGPGPEPLCLAPDSSIADDDL
jgi:hypothetical protein